MNTSVRDYLVAFKIGFYNALMKKTKRNMYIKQSEYHVTEKFL